MKLGFLLLACIAVAPPRSPVRVTGVASEYCPQSAKIEMVVENVSDSEVTTSISVDRLDNTGRWQEYSADVLGAKAHPLKVTALRLAERQSKRLEWSPKTSSNEHLLKEGEYRIVATALINGLPPGRSWVIAHFVVRNAARCKAR